MRLSALINIASLTIPLTLGAYTEDCITFGFFSTAIALISSIIFLSSQLHFEIVLPHSSGRLWHYNFGLLLSSPLLLHTFSAHFAVLVSFL